MSQILLLNPNSSLSMTKAMASSLQDLPLLRGRAIAAERIEAAPEGIETDADVAYVAPLVCERARATTADALIVACFSDPGVDEARRQSPGCMILGIAEAAYYAALPLAARFGVISLSPSSIARHSHRIAALGLIDRLAGDRAVNLNVAEASDPDHALAPMIEAGRRLIEEDGAGAVILGCAGMGIHRSQVQAALGIPVIDPVQAAAASVVAMLELNYGTKS